MIDGGLYDACLAEQGRRLYLPPVPIPAGRREVEYIQNCDCMCEPTWDWRCSNCFIPFTKGEL